MAKTIKCVPSPWTDRGNTYPGIVMCPRNQRPYYRNGEKCMKCDHLVPAARKKKKTTEEG